MRSSLRLACLLAASLALGSPPPAVARGAPDSFADLSAALLPAVVNISSTETLSADQPDGEDNSGQDGDGPPDNGAPNGGAPGPTMPFPPGSPMEKFFHDFMNRHGMGGPNDPNAPPRKMQALGSGFIIDASGIIVTNNHVIKGADSITVTLQDNTVLKATLIGHDARTDLAVLQVHADHKLPAVSFGDSDKSRVGDWVLAIGNPFGLSGTVTAGIVSSRGRDIEQGPYDDFIQTDAPINRGNSGGPLFNMAGRVIGINTAIYSPSGGSIGIGFAIPSNDASLVIAQLQKFGHARRGWIGVRIQEVTADIAQSLGLSGAHGALIAGLEPKGPAQKAGLRTGDVIEQLDGKTVDGRSLPRRVAETPVGEVAQMAIWRDGKTLTLPVTIGKFPEEAGKQASDKPPPPKVLETSIGDLGMKVAAITDALRQKFQLQGSQKGVVITEVNSGGKAASRGLQPGDVIAEVQQSEIDTPAEMQDRIAQARADKRPSVLMLVQNSDGMRWVPLPIATAEAPAHPGRRKQQDQR
ncbi:DegQ family serine endoprotease [Lichenicoccus sp.]|uniref:DegQ family serine endoprotease n=1 Tax=Lichenicoccus sp. TaxID=2781899 RepID=UPI003D122507